MKRLSLAAVGVAIALSVGAQTAPDEKKQEPSPAEGKAKVEQNTKADQKKTSTGAAIKQDERVNARSNERAGAKVEESGKVSVSYSTTVFRSGRNTSERLALHRSFRERNDIHFGIGSHNRAWWLTRYTIMLMDGCHYYLADDGCWYPAYGFNPSCNYPVEIVYCP